MICCFDKTFFGGNAIIIVIYKMHFCVGFLAQQPQKEILSFTTKKKEIFSNVSKESPKIFTLIFLVSDHSVEKREIYSHGKNTA